jgi:two-component system, NarL family, response regulator LiaR
MSTLPLSIDDCPHLRYEREDTDVKVMVVDDHDLFRVGLAHVLRDNGIRVVAEARGGETALRLVREAVPDVVLMDFNMPGMSGAEVTSRIAALAPDVHVVMLTISPDEGDVIAALMAGAIGYLLKDATLEQIVSGIRAAARGESLISPRVASKVIRRLRGRIGSDQPSTDGAPTLDDAELTERELDVLRLLSRGLDNHEIGSALFISQNTVKNHVSGILSKLHVENRIQAAVQAVRCGLA